MDLHLLGCHWTYPSTQLDFGRELIVLHTSTPSMLGKFSVQSNVIEGYTHFGMPRGTKMCLTLNKPRKIGCSVIQF